MNNDFESMLQEFRPAIPSPRLKARLRSELQDSDGFWTARNLFRSLFPVAASLGLAVAVAVTAGRDASLSNGDSITLISYGEVPAQTQTGILYRSGQAPVSVTRRSVKAFLSWHDSDRNLDMYAVVPRSELEISEIPIQ